MLNEFFDFKCQNVIVLTELARGYLAKHSLDNDSPVIPYILALPWNFQEDHLNVFRESLNYMGEHQREYIGLELDLAQRGLELLESEKVFAIRYAPPIINFNNLSY